MFLSCFRLRNLFIVYDAYNYSYENYGKLLLLNRLMSRMNIIHSKCTLRGPESECSFCFSDSEISL